jgi:hypothetical protein
VLLLPPLRTTVAQARPQEAAVGTANSKLKHEAFVPESSPRPYNPLQKKVNITGLVDTRAPNGTFGATNNSAFIGTTPGVSGVTTRAIDINSDGQVSGVGHVSLPAALSRAGVLLLHCLLLQLLLALRAAVHQPAPSTATVRTQPAHALFLTPLLASCVRAPCRRQVERSRLGINAQYPDPVLVNPNGWRVGAKGNATQVIATGAGDVKVYTQTRADAKLAPAIALAGTNVLSPGTATSYTDATAVRGRGCSSAGLRVRASASQPYYLLLPPVSHASPCLAPTLLLLLLPPLLPTHTQYARPGLQYGVTLANAEQHMQSTSECATCVSTPMLPPVSCQLLGMRPGLPFFACTDALLCCPQCPLCSQTRTSGLVRVPALEPCAPVPSLVRARLSPSART